ncbi:MAG: TonB-dependent receptor [Agriterribacter sp.]
MELKFPFPFGWQSHVDKHAVSRGRLTQTLLIMKLTAIILLATCLQVSARGFSQQITLKVKNESLEKVCEEIGKQSGYRFFFNERLLQNAKKISVELENSTIVQALDACFKDQPFNYAIVKNTIVIRKKSDVGTGPEADVPPPPVEVSGIITDEKGSPLAGATVKVKGGNGTAVADEKGSFTLTADRNDKLVFSFVGFESQEIAIKGRTTINVTLKIAAQNLDETVIIGYSKTSTQKNVAAVSTLKGENLSNLPLPTVGDGLAGRAAGVIVASSGGGPGKVPTVSIRGGGTPVYVIDGIISTEFDFKTLNVTDIDNISFLKDASATGIYGLVAGNGVVQVTTKRGVSGKLSVKYDFGYDLTQPTILPKKLSSYEVAVAKNAIAANEGRPQPYPDADVQKYKDQSDPLHFPNTDWQSLSLKKFAPQMRQNISISGGDKKFQYYGSIGYFDQGTLFKFNTNDLKRYNYRLHVTGNFDKIGVKTTLGIYGVNEDYREPYSGYDGGGGSIYYFIWGHIQNYSPMSPAYSDLAQTHYANGGDHPIVEMDPRSGYYKTQNRYTSGLLNVQWDIPWIKGWDVKINANYRQNGSWNKAWQTTAPQYAIGSDVPAQQSPPNLRTSASNGYEYTLQALTDYNRTFGLHSISVLAGYEEYYGYGENFSASRTGYLFNTVDQLFAGPNQSAQNDGSASENARAAYLGKLKYDFDGKYLVEGSFRYDGNGNLFPEGKRWGFFPAGSLGWVITKERFMDFLSKKNILNYLKYRISYGVIGQNSNAGNFAYLPGYSLNSQAYVVGGSFVPGFGDPGFPSTNITWFSQQSFNTGLDFSLLHSRLKGSVDYFYLRTKNYLASPSNAGYTDPLGTSLPLVNSSTGAFRRAGFEFHLDYSNSIGALNYTIGANFTKFDQMWEVNPNEDSATLQNPYTRSSQIIGYNTTGYHALGLYQTPEEVLNNPSRLSSTNLRPGDVMYQDANGDGKIDADDNRRIGSDPFPRINYGLTIDLNYKAWYFNMLWQGASKRDIYLNDIIANGNNIIYPFQLDYWTATNTNSLLPRATTNTDVNGNNNSATSDYWLANGRYLRLKALQIGYDLKKGLLMKTGFISDMRVTLSGMNLLTFSPAKKFYLDPETGSTNNYDYPSQRVFSVAVNVGF